MGFNCTEMNEFYSWSVDQQEQSGDQQWRVETMVTNHDHNSTRLLMSYCFCETVAIRNTTVSRKHRRQIDFLLLPVLAYQGATRVLKEAKSPPFN